MQFYWFGGLFELYKVIIKRQKGDLINISTMFRLKAELLIQESIKVCKN